MNREIVLTPATDRDIEYIVGMLEENGLVSADIPEKIDRLFLAALDGAVVGVGGVELLGEYGLLRSLAIARDQRNNGYGRAVVRGLMHHARQMGVKSLYLLTTDAAPFFEGLGFGRVQRAQAPEPITLTSEFSTL